MRPPVTLPIVFRRRRLCSVLALSVATCSLTILREASAQQLIELDTVTVEGDTTAATAWGPGNGFVATRTLTGTKTDTPLIETPQSISIVTSEQIAAQDAESIGASLRYSAGVASERTGGADTRYGGFQIRGFDATGNLFRDGLRLPPTSYVGFQSLDPYGAERIEVLKGPASVLYGQNGPGGLINYVTKRPTDAPLREVSVSGGQFDRIEGSFDISDRVDADGTLRYRLTGLARDGGSQVDHVDDDRLFIAPSLTFQPDADTSLTVLGNYQRDRAGWGLQFLPALGTVFDNDGRTIPNSRFVGEPDFDSYDTDQASIGYVFEHRFNDTLTVRQNARYSYLENTQEVFYGGGYADEDAGLLDRFGGSSRSVLNTFSIDNQAQADFATGILGHTVLFGVDYRTTGYHDRGNDYFAAPIDVFDPVYGTGITRGGPNADAKTQQDQIGVYLQDQIKLDRLSLVLAGRQDFADTDLDDRLNGSSAEKSASSFSGKAGLIYNFDMGLAPYVSYSESFLPPLDRGADGNLFDPETSRQYEAGVKYQPPGWNAFVTASVFDLVRNDAIRFDAVGGTFEARQTGQITSRGFEIEAVAGITDNLDLRAAYTYLDVEITKDPDGGNEGKTPTTVPRHSASLWADYTIADGSLLDGVGFGGGVRYVGSSFGNDANSLKVPDSTVFDAALRYERGNYEVSVNASNLFDKRYVASCFNESFGCFYAEGRRVVGKATLRW